MFLKAQLGMLRKRLKKRTLWLFRNQTEMITNLNNLRKKIIWLFGKKHDLAILVRIPANPLFHCKNLLNLHI
jgi:hypothetical protein